MGLYCLQLVATYAVVYFVCYNEVETRQCALAAKAQAKAPPDADPGAPAARARQQHARFVRLRLLFMVASGAIAVAVPKFGSLLELCGSLGNSLSIYILPHVCYLRASRTRTLADTAGACAVIGCGVVACVIGTTASLADLAAGG